MLGFVLGVLVLPLFFYTRVDIAGTNLSFRDVFRSATAVAAPSDNLNFQARLTSAAGAIVPDGYYNVEFKLYDAPTGGTALWTETYAYNSGSGSCTGPVGSNDCRVRVVHGYVSVYLGSRTSFPSTIPWDQQLYLTMNIGGTTDTGSITYDGEMTPRLKLTAVPYAMQSKRSSELATSSGANLATLSIQAPVSGSQTFVVPDQGAPGTYHLLTEEGATGAIGGNFIQNQNTAAQNGANFWIDGTGKAAGGLQGPSLDTVSVGVLTIASANATNVQIGSNTTDSTAHLFIFDSYNSTDPTGYNGAIYYNTAANKFRCYENSGWIDCITEGGTAEGPAGGDLSGSYPNPTVARINGQPITYTSLATNNLFVYNGTSWVNAITAGDLTNSLSGSTNTFTIANDAVTSIKIDDGTITGTDIALSTIGNTNLVNSSITITAGTNVSGGGSVALGGTTTINVVDNPTFGGLLTANAGVTIAAGQNFINSGSTLNTAVAISNLATGGNIGTAASTVNVATTFNVNQTTAGQTLTLPNPSTTTSGRIVYINNVGSAAFTMYGVQVGAGQSQDYIWNGAAWAALSVDGAGSGATGVGALDGQTANANGATITANNLYLQSASALNPGLVNNTTQTYSGVKTFQNGLTSSAVLTVNSGGASITGNSTIAGTLSGLTGLTSSGTINFSGIGTGIVISTGGILSSTTSLTDSQVDDTLTVSSGGTVAWTALSSYPAACSAGQAVTTLGDTITCETFALVSGASGYIQNQTTSAQSASFWVSGTGRADTSFTTPNLDTASSVDLNIGTTNASGVNIGKAGSATTIQGNLIATSDLVVQNGVSGALIASISSSANTIVLGKDANWVQQLNSGSRNWRSIASSADGTKLAAAAYSGYIYTSTDSGATWTARTTSGSRNWYSIASSADGTKLAAVVNSSSGYIYTSTDSGATWTERTGAGGTYWSSIASSADGATLIAISSSSAGYVYTSTDSGATWTERTGAGARGWKAVASSAIGTKLVAAVGYGGSGYIYTSTDSGATWTERTTAGSRIWYSIASSTDGAKLAAVVYGGYIYTSTDSGATWTAQTTSGSRNWQSIASSSDGTKLAAAVSSGYIYTSTDSGATWTEQTTVGSLSWQSIASSSDGTKLAAAVFSNYLYTLSNLATATSINGSLVQTGGGTFSTGTGTVTLNGTTIVTGLNNLNLAGGNLQTGGTARLTNNGGLQNITNYLQTSGDFTIQSTVLGVSMVKVLNNNNTITIGATSWGQQNTAGSRYWNSIASSSDGTKLAAVVGNGYIYTSTDSGATWTEQVTSGSRNWYSIASSADGAKLAAVAYNGYIYTSTDSGATWTERTTAGSRIWYSIASSTDGAKLAAVVYGGYIYTSTDSGATWTAQTTSGSRNWQSIASSADGTKLAAVVNGNYIYTSTDSGATWTAQTASGLRSWYSIASSSDGTKLAAVVSSGYIYTSTDSGATWTERTTAGSRIWQTIASSSDGTKLAAVVNGNYIYTSTDSGATWTAQTASSSRTWNSIASSADGTKLAAVVSGGYIYTSTDSGATWGQLATPGSRNWYSIASSTDGTKLAAVVYGGYIYTSTDSGATWTEQTTSGSRNWYSIASSSDGTKLAAVVSSGYIYTSTDSGATWVTQYSASSRNWNSIASSADGTKLAAGVGSGYIYTSTDSGATWTERTIAGSRQWRSIASSADGTKLAGAGYNGYISTSTDSGATWTARSGVGSRYWYSIASSADGTKLAAVVNGGYIYTSTDSGATWTEQVTAGSRQWRSITSSSDGTNLAGVVNGGYIYTSTDSGATWTEQVTAGSRNWYAITGSGDSSKIFAVVNNGYIYSFGSTSTTLVQGRIGISLDSTVGVTMVCRNASGFLSTCDPSSVVTSASIIQNQTTSAQSASFWISGSARADTSLLTPTLDAATATALNIGTTNATSINLNQSTVLGAGKSITITGGNTASRPASPTEGMVYYDTSTHQLLQWNGSKWISDRSDAVLVAASNSSQADKDAADYVADGNTAAANDGDQIQINQALTAGAGKKIILLGGIYTVDGSISVPNNTTLTGVGQGTVVTLPNAFNADISLIENSDQTAGTGVVIRDMKLDGNDANNTAGIQTGIELYNIGSPSSVGAKIQNLQIVDFHSVGIRILSVINTTVSNSSFLGMDANAACGIYDSASSGNIYSDNTFIGNYWGIRIDNSSLSTLTDNLFYESNIGITSSNTSQINITGNTFSVNYRDLAFYQVSSTVVSNNTSSNTSRGFFLDASSTNTIIGNRIQDNGGNNYNEAIFVQGDSNGNTIVGNTITDSSATTANYAISIVGSTADSNYLADNTLSGGAINDSGTGTIYGGQTNASGNYLIQPAGTISLLKNTNVTGTLQASTSLLTPTLDAATATALNIGTTNATSINLNQSTVLGAGKSITITGGNTASRPASPTEGMVYYDTDTKQLLVYANGKWQSDRTTTTKIVAAGNSSQAAKDGADFVANGEAVVGTGTIDGDQVQINAAIAALPASGGSIYLTEGIYYLDGSIVLPSNVKLSGAGDATIITVNDTFGATLTMVTNSDATNGNTNVIIRDLRFDGNDTNNSTAINAIVFTRMGTGTGMTAIPGANITSNTFDDLLGDAVSFSNSNNNRITNNAFSNGASEGVQIATGVNNIVSNNTFTNVDRAIAFSPATYSTISNNSIDLSSSANGAIDIGSASQYNLVTGNNLKNNTSISVRIGTSSHNTVTGNVFADNGGSGTASAVSVQGNSNDNVISNNTFRDTAGTGYAIDIDNSSADRTLLSGNSLFGTGASTINDLGTGTIFDGQADASGNYTIRATGTITLQNTSQTCTLATSWSCTSDGRLKAIQGNLEGSLDKLMQLTPVYYTWNSDQSQHMEIGLIAQDVQMQFPELVTTNSQGMLSLNYQGLVAPVIGAIKEQQGQINSMGVTVAAIQNSNLLGGGSISGNITINGNLAVHGEVSLTGKVRTGDIYVNGHIVSVGNAPAISVGLALGTGLSIPDQPVEGSPTVAVEGTDAAGTVEATSGAQSAASGVIAHITFNKAFESSYKVVVTAGSDSAAELRVYVVKTATGFDIISRDALNSSTQYQFDYVVIGTQNPAPAS